MHRGIQKAERVLRRLHGYAVAFFACALAFGLCFYILARSGY